MEDPNLQKAFGGEQAPGTVAASITEVGTNPAKFIGTNQDPIERPLTYMEVKNYGTGDYNGPMIWADFFRADPDGARACYARQYGVALLIASCSESQKKRMGL